MSAAAGLKGRWERLTDRERRMLVTLAGTLLVLLLAVGAYLFNDRLSTLESENDDIRQALKDIEEHRAGYAEAKRKTAQLEVRMGHGAVQLQGFLESAAKQSGVEIADSTEQPATPAGKLYVERAVVVRLRPVRLDQLAAFLHHIESDGNALVVVTGLKIDTRDDKHEDLEVELTVSTYEHAPTDKGAKKKETKPS